MKKYMLFAGAALVVGATYVWAGHFTETLPPASTYGASAVSNGYDWQLTTDSGAPSMAVAAPFTLYSRTVAQIRALTPTVVGQMVYCSNCVQSAVCISSNTTLDSYVVVGGTVPAQGGLMVCR